MDFLGDLLPILVFILIPILRGLNNSNKKKKEFQEKQKTNPRQIYPRQPYPRQTRRTTPWRELIDEVGNEFKKALEEENKKKAKGKNQKYYPAKPQDDLRQPMQSKKEEKSELLAHYGEEYPQGEVKYSLGEIGEVDEYEGTEKSKEEYIPSTSSLELSTNPILQGIIFSEILGPPKSRSRN